jgi:hypothetical protein
MNKRLGLPEEAIKAVERRRFERELKKEKRTKLQQVFSVVDKAQEELSWLLRSGNKYVFPHQREKFDFENKGKYLEDLPLYLQVEIAEKNGITPKSKEYELFSLSAQRFIYFSQEERARINALLTVHRQETIIDEKNPPTHFTHDLSK